VVLVVVAGTTLGLVGLEPHFKVILVVTDKILHLLMAVEAVAALVVLEATVLAQLVVTVVQQQHQQYLGHHKGIRVAVAVVQLRQQAQVVSLEPMQAQVAQVVAASMVVVA
jgi:hypothetical protein